MTDAPTVTVNPESTTAEPVDRLEIYKQQSSRFNNLNDTLYKIPPIFSTVIGGLWYFAVSQIDHRRWMAVGVFLFAAAVGAAGANSLAQLRLAMDKYLTRLQSFEGDSAVTLKPVPSAAGKDRDPRVSTVRGLMYLLRLSAWMSILASVITLVTA